MDSRLRGNDATGEGIIWNDYILIFTLRFALGASFHAASKLPSAISRIRGTLLRSGHSIIKKGPNGPCFIMVRPEKLMKISLILIFTLRFAQGASFHSASKLPSAISRIRGTLQRSGHSIIKKGPNGPCFIMVRPEKFEFPAF